MNRESNSERCIGKNSKFLFLVPLLILMMFIVVACNHEPQPIHYGHDACDFCGMTIVSNSFAAQAVSVKGKQYKYDAVECLVHHLGQEELELDLIWVTDLQHPGTMMDAKKAYFIINDSLKSPMGANLAAIRHERRNTFDWEELQVKLLQNASGHSPHTTKGSSKGTSDHH